MKTQHYLYSALLTLSLMFGASAQISMAGPSMNYEPHLGREAYAPGDEARVAFDFELEEGWHTNSHMPLDPLLIPTELTLEDGENYTVEQIIYPEHELATFGFSDDPLAVYESEFVVGVKLQITEDAAPGTLNISGSMRYQACNDTMCAPPKTIPVSLEVPVAETDGAATDHAALDSVDWDAATAEEAPAEETAPTATAQDAGNWRELADDFRVVGRTGYSNTDDFLAFLASAKAGEASATGDTFAGRALWVIILLTLLGGLALNLTPCVLPLIPINIAIIGAGAQGGSAGRGAAMGLAYGVGMSLAYGALGLVFILGISTAFGSINAIWWVNALFAVLFVVLALAMFDVIHIDFSKLQQKFGVRKNESSSFAVALFMGLVSAIAAGACVAPAVIAVLVYSQSEYQQGYSIALALPFLLGAGMALPWPFLGAGLSFMPKPGMWMVRVKQVLGVLILLVGAYYAWNAWQLWDSQRVDPSAVVASVEEADEDGWVHDLSAGLAQAKAENKPVLIDFWATWCKNCLVMNKTVLKDPEVLAAMEDMVKIKYQAETPDQSPVREVWEYYELVGLPAYIVLEPKAE